MRQALVPGAELDMVTPADLDERFERIDRRFDALIRDELRGVKPIRSRGSFSYLGAVSENYSIVIPGPNSGYIWSVMYLAFNWSASTLNSAYFARTTSPQNFGNTDFDPNQLRDMLGFNVVNASERSFSQTFSRGQLLLNSDESLVAFGTTGAAAVAMAMTIDAIEVPAEMVGKLVI